MARSFTNALIGEKNRNLILLFWAEYCTDHHSAPSSLEIAAHMGLCHQTIWKHLLVLQNQGKLINVNGRLKLTGAVYEPPDDLISI